MSLRDNLSRLSPNEFLEKMQDLINIYMESVDMSKIYVDRTSMGLIRKAQDFILDNFHTTYRIDGAERHINFLSPPANPNIKLTNTNIISITDAISAHLEGMADIYKENSKDNTKILNDAFVSNMNNECIRFYNWGKKNDANMYWLKNAIKKMKKVNIPLTKEVQEILNSL